MTDIEQQDNCLNCGHKIKTKKGNPVLGAVGKALDSIVSPFVSNDGHGNDPRSEAHKRMVESNRAGPTMCICGIPIFSDPSELKTIDDLFWISKVPFNPILWHDTDKGGFLGRKRKYEDGAIRIVNDSQSLDVIVQYRTRGDGILDDSKIKMFAQQDGKNVIKSSIGNLATIFLTNEYGVSFQYNFALAKGFESFLGPPKTGRSVSVSTKIATGIKVGRRLRRKSQVHYPEDYSVDSDLR